MAAATGDGKGAAVRVGVLGASGYGGAELISRLRAHPHVELVAVASRSYEGQPVEACWPHLAGLLDLAFVGAEEAIEASEVVFCATPHGATAPLVAAALAAGRRVVDLSADFRLPPDAYREWYGVEHPHPELYERARYGLVELHRGELAGVELVASPGCNATAVALALAPLATAGLLGEPIVASILTGASGAGRGPAQGLHYSELNENARAYKLAGTHRHTAEIERSIGRAAALGRHLRTHVDVPLPRVAFHPHLVPMTRGILATCTTRPPGALPSRQELLEHYREFYREDGLIVVQDDFPQTKAVAGSDRAHLGVHVDPRSGTVTALAAIDNLGKGAAGQAIQGFNVANGFAEDAGLRLEGRWP